jgi:hypothetical protein
LPNSFEQKWKKIEVNHFLARLSERYYQCAGLAATIVEQVNEQLKDTALIK